ncbi:MAG TPA: glycosyltransferase [Bacteroidales bacterium]|nr:glycosyltransferase [Bacteroidales bacterium]
MIIRLSLIIPVYNAETFISDTLARLTEWKQKINYTVQVIIVNDGSSDSTAERIENYIKTTDPSLELISIKKNRGKGYAVKTGMLAALGQFRIYTDADIPFGFGVVEKILYYLEFKEFDVCIGNRKSVQSTYFVHMDPIRKFASKIFTAIISRYVVTGVNDTQCGLKGFKAPVAEELFSKLQTRGFAFDVELLYLCFKYEYDIKRIPVSFEGNEHSTISLIKTSVQMSRDIFFLPFRYHFTKKY